ncbi:polysaccharide biosynthesis tyrosine autokinase [Bifidobacterium samirii]|uniref:Protein-tyrosine kinase n=1 Tax=Bifidobacterium samirii TaxID=2306974 RepID=A0A430FR71_9BIFI|nr:polysaccharide biosynthesis tyrosine autokinase [Bifidobacterium samirii]RSX55325.1 protein-tyrosine kinase [Bifidobacterium samirii]
MTVADILEALKKHLIVELVVLLAALAGGFLYVNQQTPQYTATAQMFASFNRNPTEAGTETDLGTPSYSEIQSQSSYVTSQLGTLPTLATTPAVLQPVIDELKLDTTVSALAGSIGISTSSTYFVNITATNTDPQTAADIANAVGRSLKEQLSSDSYSSERTYVLSYLNLSVIREASVPGSPSSPNVKSFMFKMLLIGVVAAVFAGLVAEMLDQRLRQMADLQRIAQSPTLGIIGKDKAFQEGAPVVVSAPSSRAAESVRRLALNLSFLAPDRTDRSNVIVIASSGPSEGKTTIATNLAAAMAENGERVLLVDTDLRKPSTAKTLDIDGKVGLTHLLAGKVTFADAVQRYWKENFHILPAGEQTTNPSILINSRAMQEFLEHAAAHYDHVIIDTTPMRVANDAAVFAKDGARLLLVASQGVTFKRQLRDAVQEFRMIGVEPVGTVFNQEQAKKAKNGYYYYYYYGEGKRRRSGRGSHSGSARAASAVRSGEDR